ncbi:MAG TPA: IS4 family transposase [Clostridia bacterium]|nr:IS4 family transposase [Clostridia bacterium]
MNYANQVKEILLNDISDMAKFPWFFSINPHSDFTRVRKLDFSSLLHLCICMEGGTLRHELLKYFSYDERTISNSAFYQQRCKLLPETFPFLLQQFNSHYPYSYYKGKYQLLACDGSSFSFTRNPKDTDSYFSPDGKTTNGYNQIHVVALFDLLSKRYCDAVIQPIRKKNEFQALASLIEGYWVDGAVPIYIADRGFHAYNVFAHAIEKDAYFLIRAKDQNMRRLLGKDIPDADEFDLTVDRILSRSNAAKKRLFPELDEQYRFICPGVTFDYIEHKSDKEYPITLRVLHIRIAEGIYEDIITNLPQREFTADEIKALYSMRWGIETSFRELKHVLGTTNLHSKKRIYIEQEIWSRLILYNFCTIITTHVVVKKKDRKHEYQVNYTVAFNACHYLLKSHNGETPPNIIGLIEQNILPIRPDRNFARQHRFRVPASFTYRFS